MQLTSSDVTNLVDELDALVAQRVADGWDRYWKDCMRFALPSDISQSQLEVGGLRGVTGILGQPEAYRRTKSIYDQTSMWAIERLTAGVLSIKTPEGANWHKMSVDDLFAEHEATREEEAWQDRLTRYLHKVRANPRTGFWPTHKAALRSVCALGDGFMFLEEAFGDVRVPWSYEFVPLGECYAVVDMSGRIVRFYRLRNLTAEQIATRWPDSVGSKIKSDADDPKRRQTRYPVAHAVVPRDDSVRARGIGVTAGRWRGVYIDVDSRLKLDETGYFEMPYVQHSWNKVSGRAYSEGPMALALAEIKSLNEMAKNELISAQQAVRPPLAVYGETTQRVNLNAGAVIRGMVNGDGNLLVKPIMTHQNPDFAQAVLDSRRNNVREMLYLNLWQILIERPDMTATEALLRAQEKGDLLGPVGISFNHSLSIMVDRELAILDRKGAFDEGSPLALPESLREKDVAPVFTSPLDRMRAMDEVVGAQRTVQGMLEVAALKPEIMDLLNVDRYADLLRRGNGAPADLFVEGASVEEGRQQQGQVQQLAQTLELMRAGGDAATAVGQGAQAVATGVGGGAAPAGGAGPSPDIMNALGGLAA